MAKLLIGKSPAVTSCLRLDVPSLTSPSIPSHNPSSDHHITHLYVVGLATDFCVRASALAALQAAALAPTPWKVTVVREGCRGVDPARSEAVLKELEVAGARVALLAVVEHELRTLAAG